MKQTTHPPPPQSVGVKATIKRPAKLFLSWGRLWGAWMQFLIVIYTYIHACMHGCSHTCAHTHKHTHTCTHTCMHTHTHTHTSCCSTSDHQLSSGTLTFIDHYEWLSSFFKVMGEEFHRKNNSWSHMFPHPQFLSWISVAAAEKIEASMLQALYRSVLNFEKERRKCTCQ